MNKQYPLLLNRKLLLQLFYVALDEVNGYTSVTRRLSDKYLNSENIVLIATGKAAAAMASGAKKILGDKIIQSLIVTKEGHCENLYNKTGIFCMEAGHPIPDERSLQAGQAIIQLLKDIPENASLLFLTSGGTSALVEALPDGIELSDLVLLNQWLISSGLDIKQMNQIRQSVSLLKAGRLLSYVPVNKITHLIISDVPDNDPSIIGSGMLVRQNIPKEDIQIELPEWIIAMQHAASASIKVEKEIALTIEHEIIATNKLACEAVVKDAREHGHTAYIHEQGLTGDVEDCAKYIALYLKQKAEPGIHIWGGETTIKLPSSPGQGGRNQHLALLIAKEISGYENISVLVAGTDGSDGMTPDAGAIVDGSTEAKGKIYAMDIEVFLNNANAGEYLEETGDLINTGVTGTNVMDLLIALKSP